MVVSNDRCDVVWTSTDETKTEKSWWELVRSALHFDENGEQFGFSPVFMSANVPCIFDFFRFTNNITSKFHFKTIISIIFKAKG